MPYCYHVCPRVSSTQGGGQSSPLECSLPAVMRLTPGRKKYPTRQKGICYGDEAAGLSAWPLGGRGALWRAGEACGLCPSAREPWAEPSPKHSAFPLPDTPGVQLCKGLEDTLPTQRGLGAAPGHWGGHCLRLLARPFGRLAPLAQPAWGAHRATCQVSASHRLGDKSPRPHSWGDAGTAWCSGGVPTFRPI